MTLSACASVSGTRRSPSPGDSLFALTSLDQVLVNRTRYLVRNDVALRLTLGLRLDRLPSHYAHTKREEARVARAVQRDLEGIWYDALRQDDYLTLRAVHWDLENVAEAPVYRSLDFSTVVPGASPLPAIARALSQHPIDNAMDVERYLFLLDNLAQYLPEARQALVDQAASGITMPAAVLGSVLVFLGQYRQPVQSSPFALSEDRLTRIDSVSRPKIAAALREKIELDVNRQLDSLMEYLSGSYRTAARDAMAGSQLGLGRYPGGREYYQHLLHRGTTLRVAANDLFVYGVREVERIQTAMAAIRKSVGFTGSDSAFRASLSSDPRFTVQSPNDFAVRVATVLATLRDSVRLHLGVKLQDSVVLVQRASQALDGAQFLNLREPDEIDDRYRLEYAGDRITRFPAYAIPALVARELVPGRMALISAIRRNDSLATLRQFMRFPGFVDGWGEHARALAGELGLYSDPHVAYGALVLELEAAARMVADLGVHQYAWSYPQTVRYLRLHSVDASTAGDDALRIAIADPGRAVAAKVGSREMAGQRAWVRRELGARFDDGTLHRELLRVGVLPLPILSQHLAWWVYQLKTRG